MISDYRMPYLNGCELGNKVKELNEKYQSDSYERLRQY